MAQANIKTAQSEALAFQKTVTALLTRLQELKPTTKGDEARKELLPPATDTLSPNFFLSEWNCRSMNCG